MAELFRFRTRDGRYLSGGRGGVAGGQLHVVAGVPTHLETFVAVGGSVIPLVDGGPVAVAVCDQNLQATTKLFLIFSHLEPIGSGLNRIVFGGPNTDVWVEDWGPLPPTSSNPIHMNLFTVGMNASGELSFRVTDRQVWYFRVAPDGYVWADGVTPFLDDTTFIPERGPFDCAAVSVRVLDSLTDQPLPGAAVTAPGYVGIPDGSGIFALADEANTASRCIPAGLMTLTASEPLHLSGSQPLVVPPSGAVAEQISLACREIKGLVTDENGVAVAQYEVVLTGPNQAGSDGTSVTASPDPNTGEFIFRCVTTGAYRLTYPGAADVTTVVGEPGVSGVHLVVVTSAVVGHVYDADTSQGLQGATVRIPRGAPPLPLPVAAEGPPDAGRYRLTGVRSGAQPVRAENSGYGPEEILVTVPAGGSATQDFHLRKVQAQPLVFNTGVDGTGMVLPGGQSDPHWRVIAGPGISSARAPIVLVNQSPLGTYFSSTDSAWIWVNSDGSGGTGTGYTYRLEFTLAAVSQSTRLSGGWGCDNNGQISLNSKPPAGTGVFSLTGGGTGNFQTVKFFTIVAPFRQGVNTLDVTVVDDANPGALNVTRLLLAQ